MQLIGMLDSPYVRRVAISLQLLGIKFEHQSISVFREFPKFEAINPLVKAPSLVCDDGTVLMDSTLIIDYAEALAAKAGHKSLMPAGITNRVHALRMIGLALTACEKSVQIVYERGLRPAEKLHQPWVSRVTGQLLAAFDALEEELKAHPPTASTDSIGQAGLSTAVAWYFTHMMLPEVVNAAHYPLLTDFSAKAEVLPAFSQAPHSDKVYTDS